MTFAFDATITIASILAVVFAVVGWVQMGRKAVAERIANVADRLDRHEHRLTALEQTVMGLPGKESIHELKISLESLRGDMKEIRTVQIAANEQSRRQEVVMQRVEQHLLEKSK